jgi:hypothetical protein
MKEYDYDREATERSIKKMEIRAHKAQYHMFLQRQLFDDVWPGKDGTQSDWQKAKDMVREIMLYLTDNKSFFPNYREHMEQWEIIEKVAHCRICAIKQSCDLDPGDKCFYQGFSCG